MEVIQILTGGALTANLVVLATVSALLYTMPKPPQQPTCQRLCLPSEPFSKVLELTCGCSSNGLGEYLAKAIVIENGRLESEDQKQTNTGPSPQLTGILRTVRRNIKPSARVTGKKQNHPRTFYHSMIPVREWDQKDTNAFIRYGMEYRYGRLVVPARGTYHIHSFLDLYETSRNDTSAEKRYTGHDHPSAIKHAIYRFNILNGTEEELIRTEHSREVSQNGYFNIYNSYLSAAVSLDPGDEIYVKISDLDLLVHPESNFFGVSMI